MNNSDYNKLGKLIKDLKINGYLKMLVTNKMKSNNKALLLNKLTKRKMKSREINKISKNKIKNHKNNSSNNKGNKRN